MVLSGAHIDGESKKNPRLPGERCSGFSARAFTASNIQPGELYDWQRATRGRISCAWAVKKKVISTRWLALACYLPFDFSRRFDFGSLLARLLEIILSDCILFSYFILNEDMTLGNIIMISDI